MKIKEKTKSRFTKLSASILILIFVLTHAVSVFGLYQNQMFTDINTADRYMPGVKQRVQQMKRNHPTWDFKFVYTARTFETVVSLQFAPNNGLNNPYSPYNLYEAWGKKSEWVDLNRFHKSFDANQSRGRWKAASKQAIRYTLDPRTYLNENDVFALYKPGGNSYKNSELKEMIENKLGDTKYSEVEGYDDSIIKIVKELDIDPASLLASIDQERGPITNPLNIGATGGNVYQSALNYASDHGWTDFEKGLKGGAKVIEKNYTDNGQYTHYLRKYNVLNRYNPTRHQYMQNVQAPRTEGNGTRRAIKEIVPKLDRNYTFVIPVFDRMPVNISYKPSKDISFVPEGDRYLETTLSTALRMRNKPSISGSYVITNLSDGEKADILEGPIYDASIGHEWYKIKYQGLVGYVSRGKKTSNDKNFKVLNTSSNTSKPEDGPTVPKFERILTVTANSLNVRQKPSIYGKWFASVKKGFKSEILDGPIFEKASKHEWYKINYRGKDVYVSRGNINSNDKYFTIKTEGENITPAPTGDRYIEVNVNKLNVRDRPHVFGNIIGKLDKDSQKQLVSGPHYLNNDGHEWYKIKHNGKNAYISRGTVYSSDKQFDVLEGRLETEPETNEENIVLKVTDNNLDLKEKPHIYGKVLGTLNKGDKRKIVGGPYDLNDGGREWYKIEYNGKNVYVLRGIEGSNNKSFDILNEEYAETPTPAPTPAPTQAPSPSPKEDKYLKVRVSKVELLDRPHVYGKVVSTLNNNDKREIVGGPYNLPYDKNEWYKIKENGKFVYITRGKTDSSYKHFDIIKGKLEETEESSINKLVVTEAVLNVRSNPHIYGPLVGQLTRGAKKEILGGPYSLNHDSHEWYKIKYNGKISYVSRGEKNSSDKYFRILNNKVIKMQVTTDDLNIRDSAKLSGGWITSLPKWYKTDIIGGPYYANGHEWYKIKYNGQDAYVSRGATNSNDKYFAMWEVKR